MYRQSVIRAVLWAQSLRAGWVLITRWGDEKYSYNRIQDTKGDISPNAKGHWRTVKEWLK